MSPTSITLLTRISALSCALLLANCAVNPVSGNPNFVTMSESQEVSVGRSEDKKVREQYGVYDDPALQEYVSRIGHQLAKSSHRPGLQYQFAVVDSPEINAFALPGGYIYVTRGILAYLNSEAELAAVLGHEIGHVTARHSVQQMSAATAANVGASVLQILVPQVRNSAGDLLINTLGGALLSGYGREHELEADRLGAEYLARTGYDPQAMIKVVGVLKNQELFDNEVAKAEGREPRRYHGLFATHPDNDTRLQEVVREAAKFSSAENRINREEFLKRMERVVFADSPEQGIVRNNRFYHASLGLALQFPEGWKVRNSPQNVTAFNNERTALVDLRGAGAAEGSPGDVLRKILKLGNGSSVTPTTIGGLKAAYIEQPISGKPTRVAVVFLGKNAYAIGLQANTADLFRQNLPAMEASLQSFHAITDKERELAKPLRIRIITARAGMTFAELAKTSPLGRFAEGHLRVINGLYPGGEPTAGQALKIVE
jgi:predicted Zn-dependent protease